MLTRVLIAVVLILGLAGAVSAEEIKVQSVGITDHVVTQEELEKGEALAKPRFDSPGIAHGLVTNVKKATKDEIQDMDEELPNAEYNIKQALTN